MRAANQADVPVVAVDQRPESGNGELATYIATDSVKAFGSCRLCLVEIEGRAGTPASCTTPVAEGMVVRTQTDEVARIRRGVMELYISDHPLDCLTCAANGDVAACEMSCRGQAWIWNCLASSRRVAPAS